MRYALLIDTNEAADTQASKLDQLRLAEALGCWSAAATSTIRARVRKRVLGVVR